MLHIPRTKIPIGIMSFSIMEIFKPDYDKPIIKETSKDLKEIPSEETGMERLRKMFSRDEEFNLNPQLQRCITMTSGGLIAGFFLGAFSESKNEALNFIERNQATRFASQHHAKKAVQDKVIIKFFKEGAKYGIKVATFVGLFVTSSTMMSVYNGKIRIRDFAFAGGLTGTLFKFYLGLRGALVGCITGTALGLLGGSAIYGLLSLSNFTFPSVKDYSKDFEQLNEMRKLAMNKNTEDPKVKNVIDVNKEIKEDIKETTQNLEAKKE